MNRSTAVVLAVILICSSITAGFATPATATKTTGGPADDSTTETQFSFFPLQVETSSISEPSQTAVIAPQSDQSFVAGGIYTAFVTVNVSKVGLVEGITTADDVSSPELSVSVSTPDSNEKAKIVGISPESGYNGKNLQTYPQDVRLNSDTSFAGGTQRKVLVRFHIAPDNPPSEITLSADPTPDDNSNGDSAEVTYEVTESVNQSKAMARTADARAKLSAGYLASHDALMYQEPWNDRFKRSMSDAFTVVANDAATSLVTGYADEALAGARSLENANNLAALQDAGTAYDMSQGNYGDTTVGQIAQINQELYNDLRNRMAVDDVQRAGNVSYALTRLQSLSEAEEEAWRNGNKERLRNILYKKQLVLLGYSDKVSDGYELRFTRDFDGPLGAPSNPGLSRQARAQKVAAEGEASKLFTYFAALEKYSTSQLDYIEETALPLARNPAPRVSISPSRSTMRDRLSTLESGESTTVTFIVTNKGGISSTQGYLSISTPEGLNITGFTQVAGDESVSVTNYSVGDEIFYEGDDSKKPAIHNLTDIREQYDSGETNKYTITITNESASTPWLTYRTAFEPLIHDDGARNFYRYPQQNPSVATDQQNFAAFNVSAASDGPDRPPIAQIAASKTIVQTGTTVSVDASQSTDDRGIDAYEWQVYNATSENRLYGPEAGQQASFTFDSRGVKNVTLTVTDTNGQTDTTNQSITVTSQPDLSPSFETNRTVIEPETPTQLRATTDADTYSWDLDDDGVYDDGSGSTTVWKPDTAGDATIGLQVTTSSGDQGATRLSYTVESVKKQLTAPTAVVDAPSTVSVNETVTFDASGSTDKAVSDDGELVAGEIDSYEWDFDSDDRTEKVGESVEYIFNTKGNKTVVLNLTDSDGYKTSAVLSISVTESDESNEAGTQKWNFTTNGEVSSSPTVANGTVFFGSNGTVHAVDIETGVQQWVSDGSGDPSVTVADGTVFDKGGDGNLYALDARTGTQQWAFDTFGNLNEAPTVADGSVYVASGNDLYAINAKNGTQLWASYNLGGRYVFGSSPTVKNDTVYIGSGDGRLLALDAETGNQQWKFETGAQIWSSPTVANGTVFVGNNNDSGASNSNKVDNLFAVDAETGTQKWAFETGSWILSSPTVSNGTVFVGSRDTNLYAVDATTGKQQWAFNTGDWVQSSPTVANGTVFVGSRDTNLYAVDATTGKQQWAFDTDGTVFSSPTVSDGTVFVGSDDSNLYAVDAGVDGSSNGSRVRLGTLGHLGKFRQGATTDSPTDNTPTATFSYRPATPTTGDSIEFDATNSTVPDGTITDYEWDFDDDSIKEATGKIPTHTYSSAGIYNVTLTVTDDTGLSNSSTQEIKVTEVGGCEPGVNTKDDLRCIEYGETKTSQIDRSDPENENVFGFNYEPVRFYGSTGDKVTINLNSNDLDPAVNKLTTPSGRTRSNPGGLANPVLGPPYSKSGTFFLDETGEFELRIGHSEQYARGEYEISISVDKNAVGPLPGSGTSDDPYIISTARELQAIENDLDAHYRLDSNITAANTSNWNDGRGFDPIGDASPFTGSLNGSEHTVSGLSINRPSELDVGLFGVTNDMADIQHVTITNADVVGNARVGILVGSAQPYTTIKDVSVGGKVEGESSVGGLAGVNANLPSKGPSVIRRSTAEVAVNGTQFAAGGLVGSNSGNIRASAAAGNVNGKKNVGGLVGQNIGYMFDTYADVRVSGDEFVGGLIGSSNDRSGIPGPTTLRSYAVGPVNGDQYVAGIVSFADSGSYGSLYWDTTVSGATDSDKGTGLTTEEMTGSAAKSNMPGLAFGSVWKTQSNDYPILAWQNDGVDYNKGGGNNKNPIPAFSYQPTTPTTGTTVTFDATDSTDPDGSISSYEWDLNGDGDIETSKQTATFTYDSAGEYHVNLTVNDNDGAMNTTSQTITVEVADDGGTTVPEQLKGDVTATQYAAVLNGDDTLSASNLADAINSWSANGQVNGVEIGAFELSELINYWANT